MLWPNLEIEPYDTTIEDLAERSAPVEPEAYQHTRYPWDEPLYETALDFWTRRVHYGLASWLGMKSGFPEEKPHCEKLIVLAGKQYLEPLFEHGVFEPFPWETAFPFQEHGFSGIGEQMQWLKEEAERLEEFRDQYYKDVDSGWQADVRKWRRLPDPGVDRPDVAGQSEWDDWRS